MVEAVKIRQRKVVAGRRHIPPRAELRAGGKRRVEIDEGERRGAGGHSGPAAVEQGDAAWREQGHGHDVQRVDAAHHLHAPSCDGQKVSVRHFEKVSRRESIGGRQNVGFPPSDELLAHVRGHAARPERGRGLSNRQRRPLQRAIADINAPLAFHLLEIVEPRIKRRGERQPVCRFVRRLEAHVPLERHTILIARGGLRIRRQSNFRKAAIGHALRRPRAQAGRREPRSAAPTSAPVAPVAPNSAAPGS